MAIVERDTSRAVIEGFFIPFRISEFNSFLCKKLNFENEPPAVR
jgi:hypothetical protein